MTTPYLLVPVFSWPTAPGGKLHTYAAGGTTPQGTWSDAAGTNPNSNPVPLDANGTAVVRLTAGLAYHLVLKDSTDTTTLWDADNYQASYQSDIGATLYPRTGAETTAGVTPANKSYDPEDIRRFGATGTGSSGTDDSAAFITKNTVGGRLRVTSQLTYRISNNVTLSSTTALVIDEGSAISIDAGKTLTINGPFYSSATAPFVGAGSVVFASFGTRIYVKTGTVDYEAARAGPLQAGITGRNVPHTNFNFFTSLFTITGCPAPGLASLAQDIFDVFVAQFGATTGSGVAYVAPWGNDGNAGVTWKSAYLTLAQALRLTVGVGTIYMWPGTYAPSDCRYTDTYQPHPKRIIAPYAGVRITYPGDSLSAATWTVNGTFGDMWQTTLVTTSYPIRVLNSGILDKYGQPSPMPLAAAFGTTLATALAALNNVTFGWFYDIATKILYLNNHGVNINTDSTYGKSVFSAIYGPNAGDNQVQLLSSISYWENITFDCYMLVLNSAGQATPQMWAKNCTFRYGAGNAVQVQGGIAVTQGCTAYRTTADCANYDTLNSVLPQGIEINFTTRYAGDIDTFGTGASQPSNPASSAPNKNGSSAHTGYVVRVNGNHTDAYGPTIGDTVGSYTWNLGVFAGYCQELTGGGTRNGFYASGNSWYDGCATLGDDSGYQSDTTGIVNIYNSAGSRVITSTGTISDYIPP